MLVTAGSLTPGDFSSADSLSLESDGEGMLDRSDGVVSPSLGRSDVVTSF